MKYSHDDWYNLTEQVTKEDTTEVNNDKTKKQSKKVYLFKDNTFRTRGVQVLLVLSVIEWIIALLSGYLELNFLKDIEQGVLLSRDEIAIAADENRIRQGIVGFGQTILGVTTFIFFMMWIHRSNNNARALSQDRMTYTPGWAVGWFFVPIAFLWKPYQVVKEIWQVSSNELNHSDSKGYSIVGIWWALWLFSRVFGKVAGKLTMRAEVPDGGGQVSTSIFKRPLFILQAMLPILC